MKIIPFLLLILFTAKNYAQELNAEMGKEGRAAVVKVWQQRIDSARAVSDATTELTLLPRVIDNRMWDYADYSGAYVMAVRLEKLVQENPDLPIVRQIQARLNAALGELLFKQDRLKESLQYYEKAVSFSKRDSIYYIYRDATNTIAEIYSIMENDSMALNQFRQNEKIGMPFGCGDEELCVQEYHKMLYRKMAEHYYRKGLVDSTIFYGIKANELPTSNPAQLAMEHTLLAEAYMLKGTNPDTTIAQAQKALAISLEFGIQREETKTHKILHQAFKIKREYEQAYYHFERFYSLEQDQRSFEDALQIGNMNTQLEQEKAALQQAIARQQLSEQKLIIQAVAIVLILLMLIALYIYGRLRVIDRQKSEIEAQKKRAERSEKYKEEFLANMSHEIRTPIHAISGMLKILKRNQHPDFQDKFLNAMTLSTDNLSKLLNDVLDMTKIESGKLTIIEEPFELADTIRQCQELLTERANEKGLQIESTIDPGIPNIVSGDSLRLSQILLNLLSNAIKFSDKGKIQIKASPEEDEVLFEVIDQGKGIPAEKQQQIFNAFEQAERDRSQGTGLGLTIAKRLVDLLGGAISFKSKVGEGTTFSFQLPLQQAEATSPNTTLSEEALKSMGAGHSGLKILLAEDTEFNVMLATDDLNWYFPDVQLDVAENGVQAVDLFKSNEYDLVLMDVQMPELDGYEATRKIRAYEASAGLTRKPILAMTASVLKEDLALCKEAGMDDYLPKPYASHELVLKITDQLSLA